MLKKGCYKTFKVNKIENVLYSKSFWNKIKAKNIEDKTEYYFEFIFKYNRFTYRIFVF